MTTSLQEALLGPSFTVPEVPLVHISLDSSSPRAEFGADLLDTALREAGYRTQMERPDSVRPTAAADIHVIIATRDTPAIAKLEEDDVLLYTTGAPGPDGFYLSWVSSVTVIVTSADSSGLLYGCQELADIVRRLGEIPRNLDHGETPDLILRGPAIGLQKTTVEPPRQVYEYPVTPERFPWFYDRNHWTRVLDMLTQQRANVIYIWSGHPFSSFVRVPEFPEALEVSKEQLVANAETLDWLVAEADRRGIRLFLQFYNIHIPLPFAEHHSIPLFQPQPSALTDAYTRATLAKFVETFPGVGLYVCLGEVLQGDLYGRDWLIETIFEGIRDGAHRAGLTEPPPVILRSHNIDVEPILDAARPVYPRLYTEAKYNGESLTTWNPRGEWQRQHQMLASKVDVHIANVHILADLEPFRYGSVTFIQRSVQAMRYRLHATGLHLYPLFYWDWPFSPDRTESQLLQIDRDWLWYAAWHRYAWKADRDEAAEQIYWRDQLTARFGGDESTARAVLAALDAAGQIAPRLARRVGITEGNRQTFSLGMTMSQLTNPATHRPWRDLWESHAPGGERIEAFVLREIDNQQHVGETPRDVIDDARHYARVALDAVEDFRHLPNIDGDLARVATDVLALAELTEFYALRIEAAIEIVTYRESRGRGEDPHALDSRLDRAVSLVEQSVDHYRNLAALTTKTYRFANSMRTPQRRIPFPDGMQFGHWAQCLPEYEREVYNLRANVAAMHRNAPSTSDAPRARFHEVSARLEASSRHEPFIIAPGERVVLNDDATIAAIAPEIQGLRGIRILAQQPPVTLNLSLTSPAQLLIGYFRDPGIVWLQVPSLETNTHADARGGLEPVLRNAITAPGLPPIDIHAFRYEAGQHTVLLGRGNYLVAGVVAVDQEFTGRNADKHAKEVDTLDWLYEAPTDEEDGS